MARHASQPEHLGAIAGGQRAARASRGRLGVWALAVAAVLLLQAIALLAMGRLAICKCGYVKIWHGVVHSAGNSQHVSDWYTFSHVIHGFVFYWVLSRAGRRLPVGLRLALAVAIEAAWELVENSPFVIDRYRAATVSFDYYGDTVLNSLSDSVACVGGFLLAHRLPAAVIVSLAVAFELFTLFWIRDNLTLNIVMLLWPLDAIRNWQAGA